MAGIVGSDVGAISRMRSGENNISVKLFLNAATVLDMSPKKLIKAVGLPEYYFFEKRRGFEC